MKKGSGQCLKICSKIKNRVKLTCNTIVSNINDEKNISFFETLQVCLKILFVCPPLAGSSEARVIAINGGKQSHAGRKTRRKETFLFLLSLWFDYNETLSLQSFGTGDSMCY